MIWCNSHRRPIKICQEGRGGILLPCQPVDLTDILEIEYLDD